MAIDPTWRIHAVQESRERPGMCKVREPMLQGPARLPPGNRDKRCGMFPRADRIVNGDQGIQLLASESGDREPAVAEFICPDNARFLGVGNTLAIEMAGQGPEPGRAERLIMTRQTVFGVFGGMAFATGEPADERFGQAGITRGFRGRLDPGLILSCSTDDPKDEPKADEKEKRQYPH